MTGDLKTFLRLYIRGGFHVMVFEGVVPKTLTDYHLPMIDRGGDDAGVFYLKIKE